MWNKAIWKKTWGEQRLLVLSLAALWGAFPWIYIGLSAQIAMPNFQLLLGLIPADWQKLSAVPIAEVATYPGRVALAFVDPVVVLAATAWGITRGSDVVSGPLERGTLEMTLAAPLRRTALFCTHALATTAAAAILCGVLLASVWTAVAFGPWAGRVEPSAFVPAACNVFGLMVCMAGLAACVSAADSHRWRTIGILGAFYVFTILLKLVGRLGPGLVSWCGYLSILNAYEPQRLVGGTAASWWLLACYDGILLAVGIGGYALGAVLFTRRDLPAPL